MRSVRFVSPIAAVIIGLSAIIFTVTAYRVPDSAFRVERADSTADLLVVKAFSEGMNPYQDVYFLADHFSVDYVNAIERGDADIIHPRTPGSLVLLFPLAPLDAKAAMSAILTFGFAALALGSILIAREVGASYLLLFAAISYGLLAGPARWSFAYGTQSTLLWGVMAIFMVACFRKWERLAGVSLGIAGILKAFPLLLVFWLLVQRRWKALAIGLGTFAVINGLALLTPAVAMTDVIKAAASSIENWFEMSVNISLAASLNRIVELPEAAIALIQLLLVVGGIVVVWMRRLGIYEAVPMLTCVGILASPLAWPHYVLLLVPVLIPVLARVRNVTPAASALVLGLLLTLPTQAIDLYTLGLVIIAVVLGFFSPLAFESDEREESHVSGRPNLEEAI